MISTGSRELDSILNGGIRFSALTNIFGASSSGKTQLCFQLCVNVTKPKSMGGFECNALFIDTLNNFRPERIIEIASHLGITNSRSVLDRIYVSRAYTTSDVIKSLKRVEEIPDLRLVVIDGISESFMLEYKRSMLLERYLALSRFLRYLALLALKFDLAVIATNGMVFTGTEQRQRFDRIISMFAHFKIMLNKDHNHLFTAVLLQPVSREARFRISIKGIEDL